MRSGFRVLMYATVRARSARSEKMARMVKMVKSTARRRRAGLKRHFEGVSARKWSKPVKFETA